MAVLTIGVGAVFGARLDTDPTLVQSPLLGTSVPDRSLPALEGGSSTSLAQFRGQVVVVNFWASWCVPCRQEHPALLAAARAYRDQGVQFVGVSYQDRSSSAKSFLDELGRGGENYSYLTDPGSRMAIDFGVFGVPETFFVDPRGRIVGKITGPSSLDLLAGALEAMVAGESPSPEVKTGDVQPGPGAGQP